MRSVLDGRSPQEKEEIIADAANLLGDKATQAVFERLEEHYILILKAEPVGSLQAGTAHASLQVLEQVRKEMQLVLSSVKFEQRKGSR